MKKIAAIAAACLLSLTAACGDDDAETKDTSSSSEQESSDRDEKKKDRDDEKKNDDRDDERPSEADLAAVFESQSSSTLPIDAAAAACMAEVVHGSDISDETLQDIADGEIDLTGYVVRMPQDDLTAWEAVTDETVACITG